MGELTDKFTADTDSPDGIRRDLVNGDQRAEYFRDLEVAKRLQSLADGRTLGQRR